VDLRRRSDAAGAATSARGTKQRQRLIVATLNISGEDRSRGTPVSVLRERESR